MKPIFIFLFIIALNFSSVNNSNNLPKRNLDSTDNKKLLLIGFGGFSKYIYAPDLYFKMYLKKIDNSLNFSFIYLNSIVNYQDETTKKDMGINCTKNTESQYLLYDCRVENRNISNNITNITINNYALNLSYFNQSSNFTLTENEILLSSIAKDTMKNIENREEDIDFLIFYLNEEPNITKNEVILYGKIDYENNVPLDFFNFNLSLKENTNCTYYYYNYTKSNSDIITFTPKNNINTHLNGMMSMTSFGENYILFFANNTDDLILYSKDQIAYVELLGFGNYTEPKTDKDATNLVYFRGTANNLKKYVRFNVTITNSSSLRALEDIKIIATGTLKYIDLDNGLAIYEVTYEGTKGMMIVSIKSEDDYRFSNDKDNFDSSAVIIIIIGYINLTNTDIVVTEFVNSMSQSPRISGNSFSFDMKFPNTNQSLNISDKKTMYLNYYNLENSKRDEIDCSIENKTSHFTILCEPKKDVYTQFKTLIMKIPKVPSSRRLRFLQTTGNSTYYAPTNATGDIQFEYNPEVNTFGRKASKKKGLSGGAIAAIVLATIAAVAAVTVAMFFLNRGPVNPIKTSTEMNLPNSTTNINN